MDLLPGEKHSPLARTDNANDNDKSNDENANAKMNINSIHNGDNNFKSPNSFVQAQQSLLASTPTIKSELIEGEMNENIENLLTADEVGDFPISFSTSSGPKDAVPLHDDNNKFQFVHPLPPTNKQEHPLQGQVVTIGAQPPAAMTEIHLAAASKPKPEPTAPASGFDLLSAISRDGWSVVNAARTSTSVTSFQQQRNSLTTYSTAPTSARPGSCSCSKTHCLKMYCACFRDSKLCSRDCHCIDCDNTLEESRIGGKLHFARNELLKKKQFSTAFGNRTCRCTKTHCLKMYCVCFSNGAACAEKCKCVGCENPRGRTLSF